MPIQAVDHASTSQHDVTSGDPAAPAASFEDVLDAVGSGWMQRAGLSARHPGGQFMQAGAAPAQTLPTPGRANSADEQRPDDEGDGTSKASQREPDNAAPNPAQDAGAAPAAAEAQARALQPRQRDDQHSQVNNPAHARPSSRDMRLDRERAANPTTPEPQREQSASDQGTTDQARKPPTSNGVANSGNVGPEIAVPSGSAVSKPAAGSTKADGSAGSVSAIRAADGGAGTPASPRKAAELLSRLEKSKLPVLKFEGEPDPAKQVVRGLAAALRHGDGKVTLRLAPDHLGLITVDLQVDGEAVSARLRAESESARSLLEKSSSELRAALEARGLSVERIDIEGPQPTRGSALAQDAPGGNQGPNQFGDSAGGQRNGQHDAERRLPGRTLRHAALATDGDAPQTQRRLAAIGETTPGLLRLDALA